MYGAENTGAKERYLYFFKFKLDSVVDIRHIETSSGQHFHWKVCTVEINLPPMFGFMMLPQEILDIHRLDSLYTTYNIVQVDLPLRERCLRGGKLALSYVVRVARRSLRLYSAGTR